jgi:hypothetical protein
MIQETQTRTTAQPQPTQSIIKSVYAKVATGGTVESPRYELLKINFEFTGGTDHKGDRWHELTRANGETCYCTRGDMLQLFPIFGA